jgi:hypothetical protein
MTADFAPAVEAANIERFDEKVGDITFACTSIC